MYLFNKNFTTALEMLLNSDLAWGVIKEKLVTESGIESEHVAIVRDDNNAILGVHKGSYEVFNNQQMAEVLVQMSQATNLPIHSAGSLKGGCKVYIQLKAEDLNLGADKIKGFLTAVNSYDGSTSLAFGLSTTTISCSNTFFGAYRQLENKIKHTKSMQIKIEDLLKSVDTFREDEAKHFTAIQKMASTSATRETLEMIYNVMFNVTMADVLQNSDAISTRTRNNIARLNEAIALETADKGATLWGQFSGVTRYTTHMVNQNDDSKMFGSIANKDRAIFSKVAEMVN